LDIGERFFAPSAAEWRDWLEHHHDSRKDIWLILHKKGSQEASVRFEEAVEEALCFGWVDSQTKSVDSQSYALRFSPCRKNSNWSAANRALAVRLIREGRMTGAGLAVLPDVLQPG
jgi:uncharacterized protein YdeI (YjbR/CyaY-like superfamily)